MPSTNAFIILLLLAACYLVTAAPIADNQFENAYSGVGGHASGGSVTQDTPRGTRLLGGLGLIKIFSDNAGRGGLASSGPAIAKAASGRNAKGGSPNGPSGENIVSNAYSGAGGVADGGSVDASGNDLITLFSENAGNGGVANSGLAGSGIDTFKSKKIPHRGPGPKMVLRSTRLRSSRPSRTL